MEQALKQATEETHKKMEEEQKKTGGSLVQSHAMTALQAKQKKEEEDLKVKIAHEELERQ